MSQSRTGRTMSLAVLIALVAALAMWMRSRSRPIQVDDPPEWPPLPPLEDGETATTRSDRGPDPAAVTAVRADSTASLESTAGAEPTATAWRASDDGTCPDGFPIKAKDGSGIFHVPGGRFYDRTKADRCYPDAAAAIADGYRQSKT